ncbi:putative flavoprotein [Aspergillus aculeatinus CBS 121060]|uniref:Flavo protein n=1 Tax=Aspergillus aculeatinus CBS 121060 TaxID=1448322 RepID=A0ACD1HMP7_9EURO|nr:putative flavo protein [Aspergillus aculeatinus CBS 121060]RAH74667.1 putative flavo protein [Aspergillus aculeatinus CBS 121060]
MNDKVENSWKKVYGFCGELLHRSQANSGARSFETAQVYPQFRTFSNKNPLDSHFMEYSPPPPSAQTHFHDEKIHIILAASGSVATIKLPNIAQALSRHHNVSIRIIVTKSAERFLDGQSLEQPSLEALRAVPGVEAIYRDEDEWKNPWTRGEPILHIELRKWAHLLLVAPLSANTMAKMTMGIADNLLLSVIRAWDTTGMVDGNLKTKKPLIFVAPAMNTAMWNHPITGKQIEILEKEWGVNNSSKDGWVSVLRPMEKHLACGDTGNGAMMDWEAIVCVVEQYIGVQTRRRSNITG